MIVSFFNGGDIIFISDKFYLNGIHSDEKSICLAMMDSNIINDYGLVYSEDIMLTKNSRVSSYYVTGEEEIEDIVLEMYYVDDYERLLVWEDDKLQDIMSWLVTDTFVPFISEDNLELTYYFKTKKIVKKFTPDKRGYLEVTFKPFSSFAYKNFTKSFIVNSEPKNIYFYNYSNVEKDYSPIFEIENLGDESTVISIRNSNNTLDESLTITGLSVNQKVTIDNLTGTVTGSDGSNLISKCNRKWFKMNETGTMIEFKGSSRIEFKAQFPVRV